MEDLPSFDKLTCVTFEFMTDAAELLETYQAGIDVAEVCGGMARCSRVAVRRHLKHGKNFDLVTGWDMHNEAHALQPCKFLLHTFSLSSRGRLPYYCTLCCRAYCFACDCAKAFSGGKCLQMIMPPASYSCQHTNTGGFDGLPFRNHPISSRHCLLRGRTK